MNRCQNCRNSRRQLLMLKCSHDVCIRCAADHYFVSCATNPALKKAKNAQFYCEKCLEVTPLDGQTVEQLRKYFMEGGKQQDVKGENRRERGRERQEKKGGGEGRARSLDVELEERRRALSKYLNDKQVDKFMEMQNEYGARKRDTARATIKNQKSAQHKAYPSAPSCPMSPQTHNSNEYQLQKYGREGRSGSIEQRMMAMAVEQRVSNDYRQERQERQERRTQKQQEYPASSNQAIEYELYGLRNKGKTSPRQNMNSNGYEQKREETPRGRKSHSSSNKAIGTIRSKKSLPKYQEPISPIPQKIPSLHMTETPREQRGSVDRQYRPRNSENSLDWESQSRSTKRNTQQRTIPHSERHHIQGIERVLDTLQSSSNRQKTSQAATEKTPLPSQPSFMQRTYYCKIHPDEEIIYFCLTCSQLACSECALHGSHRQHQVFSLRKSCGVLREGLEGGWQSLGRQLLEEQGRQRVLRECLGELSGECGREKERVRGAFESFMNQVERKYKEMVKEVEERYTHAMQDYSDRLNQSRSVAGQLTNMREKVGETLANCARMADEGGDGDKKQMGGVQIKHRHRPNHSHAIETIQKLTARSEELSEFIKTANIVVFSSRKEALLSESSLKLSESSHLLDNKQSSQFGSHLPARTPRKQRQTHGVSTPGVDLRKVVRVVEGSAVVDSLQEMQEIVKAFRYAQVEYRLKCLQV